MNLLRKSSLHAATITLVSLGAGLAAPASWGQTPATAPAPLGNQPAPITTPLTEPLETEPLELEGSPINGERQQNDSRINFPDLLNQSDLFTDYLLGPGDQIQVQVIGYDEFVGPRVVLPDGTISMPLIGSVPAAGKTLDALANDMSSRLSYYLTNPVVDTNLSVLRPVVVNVVGEVYRPGPVQLSSLTQVNTAIRDNATLTNFTNTPTLSTALVTAGGIRRTADIRSVTIQRRLADGRQVEFNVNLWEALNGRDELGVLVMFDGDTVTVPKALPNEVLDTRLIASSSIAPTNVRVRVVGEVERPGEVLVQPNSSLSSAVAAAGGYTDDAQSSDVKLVRLTDSGQIEEQQIDLSSLIDEYQVQDGDVIVVEKRGLYRAIDNFSRVLNPILIPLNLLNILNVFGD